MKKQKGSALAGMMFFMVFVFGTIGWVMNIYHLYHAVHAEVWTTVVIRAIGVFMAPLGAVLGYIPF